MSVKKTILALTDPMVKLACSWNLFKRRRKHPSGVFNTVGLMSPVSALFSQAAKQSTSHLGTIRRQALAMLLATAGRD